MNLLRLEIEAHASSQKMNRLGQIYGQLGISCYLIAARIGVSDY